MDTFLARLYAISVMESGTTLMVPSYDQWIVFGEPRIPRSLSSVILDEGITENLFQDIQNFVDDKSWYLDRGTVLIFYIHLIFNIVKFF